MKELFGIYALLDGEAATTATTQQGSGWITIAMLVVLGLVMYFMMIRPQKKQEKSIKEMRDSLAVGDEITTTGGIIGKVVRIREETVTIMTGKEGTTLRILKSAIAHIDVKANATEESTEEDANK